MSQDQPENRGVSKERPENELIATMHRCPHCKQNLRLMTLDIYKDAADGQQYERLWWTCPGISSGKCHFPLDMPMDVFWTKRNMFQMSRSIKPSPNLHLLPQRLRHLYPTLFKSKHINIKSLVEYTSFAPPRAESSEQLLISPAFATTQPSALRLKLLGGLDVGPSRERERGSDPSTVAISKPFTSNKNAEEETVGAYLKAQLQKKLSLAHDELEENRKGFDLCPNSSDAIRSHLLLGSTHVVLDIDLEALTSRAIHSKSPGVSTNLSQQQQNRLQSQIRRFNELAKSKEDKEEPSVTRVRRPKRKQGTSRYVYSAIGRKEAIPNQTPDKAMKIVSKRIKQSEEDNKNGDGRENIAPKRRTLNLCVNTIKYLDLVKKEREFLDRLGAGLSIDTSSVANGEVVSDSNRHAACKAPGDGRNVESQSRTVSARSKIDSATAQLGSTSNGGVRRASVVESRGMSGLIEYEDPSLEEEIKQRFEANLRLLLTHRRTSRSQTPSSLIAERPQNYSPVESDFFSSAGNLSGIPHNFEQNAALAPEPRVSQLAPINYGEGEDVSSRFSDAILHGTVIEFHQSSLAFGAEEEEEFDFEMGLEDDFGETGGGTDGDFLRKQMELGR